MPLYHGPSFEFSPSVHTHAHTTNTVVQEQSLKFSWWWWWSSWDGLFVLLMSSGWLWCDVWYAFCHLFCCHTRKWRRWVNNRFTSSFSIHTYSTYIWMHLSRAYPHMKSRRLNGSHSGEKCRVHIGTGTGTGMWMWSPENTINCHHYRHPLTFWCSLQNTERPANQWTGQQANTQYKYEATS